MNAPHRKSPARYDIRISDSNVFRIAGVNLGVNLPMSHLVKRTLPPLSLSRTPLILVLAQIKVSPIERIADYFPLFQDRIRKEGFPKLMKRAYETHEIQGGDQIKVQRREQWEFINSAMTASLLLDSESLVCQTTDYRSADDFLSMLIRAAKIFQEVVEPTSVERIGLRYLDLIEPEEDAPLSELVSPSLRGFDFSAEGKRLVHVSEDLLNTGPHRKIRIRYTEAESGVALPSDMIGPRGISFRRDPVRNSPYGLLDFDHFDETSFDYDPTRIEESTGELHDLLDISFRKLTTDTARELWK